jgi:hypothetical protein
MTIDSASAFVSEIRQHQLIDPSAMEELAGLQAQFPQIKALAAEVLRRGSRSANSSAAGARS